MSIKRKWLRLAICGCLSAGLTVAILGGFVIKSMDSRQDLIEIGQPASPFTAKTSEGKEVKLSDFRGKKNVILVFYPADNTSVCTAQLCAFRDNWSELESADAVVLGVNPAGAVKHSDFATKNKFPFSLLVDDGAKIADSYGCRAIFGIIKRTVYVINKTGKVVWAKRGNPAPAEALAQLQKANSIPTQ